MTDLALADDPFNTALDRVILDQHITGAEFNRRYDSHQWSQLTPTEQSDMLIYWQAVGDNQRWDVMIIRHKSKTRMGWNIRLMCWDLEPFTDAAKAAERAAFQGLSPKFPLARRKQ